MLADFAEADMAAGPAPSWRSASLRRVQPTSRSQPNACITNCQTVQLLSTVTARTWIAQARGVQLLASDWAFSPDSSLLLVRTHDRKLYLAPIEVDGEARLIETDVDQADWAGSDHVVINRTQSSPQGVSFLRAR